MKKIFLFATIAAAGLFASCSSSDDAVSDALNNPIEDADGRQAIKIGISNTVNMATRGTGTVGGVENNTDGIQNVWAGQRINVFMFTQEHIPAVIENNVTTTPEAWNTKLDLTTVDEIPLYDNQVMITPGTTENLIDEMSATNKSAGEAMIADGTINYYPIEGRYDFFGYHGDDAVNAGDAINKTDAKWTVPFEIDGSQDLMSTKAVLTAEQAGVMGSKADANKNNYYSAYSARQGVQPTLTFNHLLTRLQFKVKAGNVNATGYEAEVTADAAKTHNEALENGLLDADVAYNFTARLTGELDASEPSWETAGIVKRLGTAANGDYTVVQVVANGPGNPLANFDPVANDYVGQIMAVPGSAMTPPLALYGAAKVGNDYYVGDAVGMSVKTLSVTTAEQKLAHNATLPGAITAHAAGQNLAKAVKVKSIQINSKKAGNMAVAWTGNASDYTYEMSMMTAADWGTLDADHKLHWAEKNSTDPTPVLLGYTWNVSGTIDHTYYLTQLSDLERKYATVKTGALTDAQKIEWAETTDWLTLKERPYAKLKAGMTKEDADVDGYAAAKAAIDENGLLATNLANAIADYNTKAAAVPTTPITDPTDPGYDDYQAKKAAADNALIVKNYAQKRWDEAEALEAALRPSNLMTETISEEVFNMLTAAGKDKYDTDAHKMLNENLITLTPTAPALDGTNPTTVFPQTPVGEALIVAPKETGDYEMKVTIQQDVPTSWENPTALTTKEIEYPLTIKAPTDGFKVNYSYNIILTVYGLERIEVITVITPWEDNHDPIVIGKD